MKLTQVLCVLFGLVAVAGATPNAVAESKRWQIHHKGVLTITASNGTFIGYVASKLSRYGTYVADRRKHKAASISFTAAESGTSKDLLLTDETAEYPNVPFVGAVIPTGFSLSSGKKRAGHSSSAGTAGTSKTNPNQPPASLPNSANPSGNNAPPRRAVGENDIAARSPYFQVESSIWAYDATHKRFTGSFVNPDRKPVSVVLHYNPRSPPGVNLVSDVHAYKAEHPESFPISVHFVSD